MHNFSYKNEEDHKNELNLFLEEQRSQNSLYKVIDVGGAVGPWFWGNVDTILDFIPPNGFNGNYFQGDITKPWGWDEIKKYVKKNGKFNFSICRQTLEDISDPEYVCHMLSEISHSGWIGVPSKHMEMMRGWYSEYPETRGLHHHRWIYVSKNGKWYGLPKMGWTDSIQDDQLPNIKSADKSRKLELGFYWSDSINVFWVLPFTDNLPENYGDEFIRSCMQGVHHPWDLWVNILNNSD